MKDSTKVLECLNEKRIGKATHKRLMYGEILLVTFLRNLRENFILCHSNNIFNNCYSKRKGIRNAFGEIFYCL